MVDGDRHFFHVFFHFSPKIDVATPLLMAGSFFRCTIHLHAETVAHDLRVVLKSLQTLNHSFAAREIREVFSVWSPVLLYAWIAYTPMYATSPPRCCCLYAHCMNLIVYTRTYFLAISITLAQISHLDEVSISTANVDRECHQVLSKCGFKHTTPQYEPPRPFAWAGFVLELGRGHENCLSQNGHPISMQRPTWLARSCIRQGSTSMHT